MKKNEEDYREVITLTDRLIMVINYTKRLIKTYKDDYIVSEKKYDENFTAKNFDEYKEKMKSGDFSEK